MEVIAECESRSQNVGTGERSTFGQPRAICSEGQYACLVDTANATICLLTGTTLPQELQTIWRRLASCMIYFLCMQTTDCLWMLL